MTSTALSAGCALLAFSPSLSLLFLIAYNKAQLVIIVTTSAFAHLLSALFSSLIYFPFRSLLDNGNHRYNSWLIIIPTAVFSQSLLRCGFVRLYHRVEAVIEQSIQRHEQLEAASSNDGDGNGDANHIDPNNAESQLSETAKLRLELNDVSCGIAAGTGFGGMHTVLLYGTLLASEGGSEGTLYQPSCSVMPSLVNSALMAFLFAVLDIVLMLLCFYGIRRLEQDESLLRRNRSWSFTRGSFGGRTALAVMIVLHFLASMATVFNTFLNDGCLVSLPLLGVIMISSVVFFFIFVMDGYLPEGQRRRIRQAEYPHED